MKRDMEIIRKMLLLARDQITCYQSDFRQVITEGEISRWSNLYCHMLIEGGLLMPVNEWEVQLTWKGMEAADLFSDQFVWDQAKVKIADALNGSASFEIWFQLCRTIALGIVQQPDPAEATIAELPPGSYFAK